MLSYLVRKLVLSFLLLVAISYSAFWVLAAHLNPLYPLLFSNPRPTEKIELLTRQSHLDASIPERYWFWLKGSVNGGAAARTILDQTPFWGDVWTALGRTLELAVGGLFVALVFGVVVGVVSAWRLGRPSDRLLPAVSYLTWSTPVFVTALVLQAGVARIERSTGLQPFLPAGVPTGSGFAYVGSWFRHMTLPITAVALSCIGLYSRYVRSAMLVTLTAPYTTVARAKGLRESRVVVRHALRNALLPLVAAVTVDLSAILGTTLAVDIIFGLRGLGSLFVGSLRVVDPYLLDAILGVTVLAVIGLTLLSDVVYGWLDPRIRIS
ncbi:MAG: ABC transporter permease [Gaiellaceae bacterium]